MLKIQSHDVLQVHALHGHTQQGSTKAFLPTAVPVPPLALPGLQALNVMGM